MKNTVLFFTAIALSLFFRVQAQNEYNFEGVNPFVFTDYYPIHYVPSKNVKQIEFIITDHKGKSWSCIKKYNANGKISEITVQNENKGYKPWLKYQYDDSLKYIKKTEEYKKGEINAVLNYERNFKGIPVLIEKKNSKGKILIKDTWTYNEKNLLTESVKYKKDGKKADKVWKYNYNEEDKKTRSALYDAKGKLIYEWTFNCDEKGTKLEKVKDQTQVCRWDESEENYLIKVYQTFNEKGKIVKNISKFTKQDTLPVEYRQLDENDVLIYKRTYDNDYRKPLTFEMYKKGNLAFKVVYTYNVSLLVSEESFSKNGFFRKVDYSYNEDDLLFETKEYNRKSKLIKTVKLIYEL